MKWRPMKCGLAALVLTAAVSGCAVLEESGSRTTRAAGPYPQIETGAHTAMIWRIAVDSSERWLVTASDDKTARVWNLKTGTLERTLRPPIGEGDDGKLYAVAISPDGGRVALGGFTGDRATSKFPVYLFDRASGALTAHSADFSEVVHNLAFSPDGTRLAATFGSGMRILRASDLVELVRDDDCALRGHGADFDRAGRLVTTCYDGALRLYDANGRRIARRGIEGGGRPYTARFSPDGERIAVGFEDSMAVTVVSGRDLSFLYGTDTRLVTNGTLSAVAWSRDGRRLFAAGRFQRGDSFPILVWPDQGRGSPSLLDGSSATVMDLATLSGGRLIFGAADPAWGAIGPGGQRERLVLPAVLDHRDNQKLRVSADGRRVEFGFNVWDGQRWSRTLARFDLDSRTLERVSSPAPGLSAPRTDGLAVSDWRNHREPKLNGKRIALEPYERCRALAIARDGSGFVLGTEWWLRGFDANGRQRWQQPVPATAWTVNLSEDGRFVLAALGDGTIRWYDTASGGERLALFVHARDRRWVLWTPEGFFDASPGADTLIGYQLNQGPDRAGEFVDASQLATVFYRPDLISRRVAGDEATVADAVKRIGDVRTVLAGDLPPRVELLSRASADTDGDYDLTVRITPGRGSVGRLTLRINGAEVAARGEAPPGGGTVTQRLTLAPGTNVVSVAALTRDGKVGSNETFAVVRVKASEAKPALRIVAVGISLYDDASFKDGVKFAASDADEVVRRLRIGASGVYREVDTTVLTRREDTSLKRIEAEIAGLARRAQPEDVVVIYLAGHGKAYEGEYHFIPSDFRYDSDQAYRRGTTLSHRKVEALLKTLGAGKRLLILDTCSSGAALAGRSSNDEKDAIARLMRSSGRYILAAASPQGKALEGGEQGHGLYSYALMEGLAGAADRAPNGNNNVLIEVDELANYVARRVPELTARYGYQQVPMRSASGQSFWITRTPKTP